jgi:homoserine kinase type II
MAIYTQVSVAQANALLAELAMGSVVQMTPAASGIENTTYLLTTQSQGLVLTLFEMLAATDIDFYAQLLSFLATQRLPVPRPLAHPLHGFHYALNAKPALVLTRLTGEHLQHPNDHHAMQISEFLAKLHLCTADYSPQRHNTRDFNWIRQQQLRLSETDTALLQRAIDHLQPIVALFAQLPQALLHGDLFVDNTLFVGDQLTGVIDFYNAHTGAALWDLAIAVLAWCSDAAGALNQSRMQKMLESYQQLRPLSSDEQKLWFHLLTYAALRFWASRLLFWQSRTPASTELYQQKDPTQFKNLLKHLIEK